MTPSTASPGWRGGSPLPKIALGSPAHSVLQVEDFPVLKSTDGLAADREIVRVSKSDTPEGLSEEISSSNQAMGIQKEKRSFLQAAQKRAFTQQKFVVSEVDGCEKVVVPREVFVGAKPLWEDFLIGKLLNSKAPHVGRIHMIVNKIWRLADRSSLIDVFAVNESTVKFRIRNESMRNRVLNRGMWNLMDIHMIVSKWTPFAEEAQPAMKSIPLWITLTDVPPTMFTDKGLEFLANAVGKPVRLHPKTEACDSFDEAKILVEADLTKELPKEYVFIGEEEGELDTVIKYSYPWLPPRCSHCKKWGHLNTTCLNAATTDVQETLHVAENSTQEIGKLGDQEVVKTPTEACSGSMSLVTEKEKEQTPEGEKILDANKDEGWSSPKTGRTSPHQKSQSLNYGEVSILSNAYSVLAAEDDSEDKTELQSETFHELKVDDSMGENRVTKLHEGCQETETVEKVDPPRMEIPPRQSLPRDSKTALKIIPQYTNQSARDQSKRSLSKKH